jgi:hypothetical protein
MGGAFFPGRCRWASEFCTVGAGEIVDFFGRRSFDSILRITKHRKLMETRLSGPDDAED